MKIVREQWHRSNAYFTKGKKSKKNIINTRSMRIFEMKSMYNNINRKKDIGVDIENLSLVPATSRQDVDPSSMLRAIQWRVVHNLYPLPTNLNTW